MCGIAGILDPKGRVLSQKRLAELGRALAHRGPDDDGIFLAGPAGLVSRRLAVIDLSDRAHMPMANEDGTLHAVHNGEIYNFPELRETLEARGHTFRSHSDTEVILHAYEEWGPAAVTRFCGMFAFALWDAPAQRLFLARDRLGVKPLFFCRHDGAFLFASELHALYRVIPPRAEDIDPVALDYYLSFAYVPPDRAFLRPFTKLPPAHTCTIETGGPPRLQRYWSPPTHAEPPLPEEEALERVESGLRRAVRRRLIADVPVGCFLSGGIDSALVTAFAAQETGAPVHTFSVGFEHCRPEADERPLARLVADRYATDHTELLVSPRDHTCLSRLLYHYGEPFADLSALPVFLISEAARRTITVALTGDGGDESFCGYANVHAGHLADRFGWFVPPPLARLAARVLRSSGATRCPPLRRTATWLDQYVARPVADQFDLINHWQQRLRADLYAPTRKPGTTPLPAQTLIANTLAPVASFPQGTQQLWYDLHMRLPGDYLTKVDIASSLVALEIRSPFLDHELVEIAARLPVGQRLRGNRQKGLLRHLAARHLPEALIQAPKRGFGPDLDSWLRGDWSGLVRVLVADRLAAREGLFQPERLRQTVAEHIAGRADHRTRLWTLACLEIWWELFIDRSLTPGAPLLS